MKATELADILARGLNRDLTTLGDCEVVIHLAGHQSIGPRAAMPVKSAAFGFDWERGRFTLEPNEPLGKIMAEARDPMPGVQQHVERIGAYSRSMAHHLEMLAAAYLKHSKLPPDRVVLCQRITPDGEIRCWFEAKER